MTGRERQIARLTAAGLRDSEIAAEIGLSVRTVKECKYRAAHRMGYKGKRLDVFLVSAVCGDVPSQARLMRFAPRLRRTAELVMRGRTNSEVAATLEMSEDTVKNYLREIYDLAGVWSRRELARFLSEEPRQERSTGTLSRAPVNGPPCVERSRQAAEKVSRPAQ
jgi:DNA-binding NarL/FixJ family response regulator